MPILDIAAIKEAQENQNIVVAEQRVTLLKAEDDLNSIGGKIDYVIQLRKIVQANPNGILLSRIQTILPDGKALSEARKALKDEISEEPKKKSFVLNGTYLRRLFVDYWWLNRGEYFYKRPCRLLHRCSSR